jgi:hypothetical protein
MKYEGNFVWEHTLFGHPLVFEGERCSLISRVESERGGVSKFKVRADFEFESDFTDWNDLKPLVLEKYEAEAANFFPEITVEHSLTAIHIEEHP